MEEAAENEKWRIGTELVVPDAAAIPAWAKPDL